MDYFAEIESHFASKRGTPFVVNPKDWALMKEWLEAGVPLPVVIEAIDSVFEKAAERNKVVNSIHYCKHAVKELWDERRELTVGDGSSTPEASPSEALEALASQVPEPFASRVRGLAAEKSVPRIEEKLIELEREMIDALIASLPEAERPVITLPPGVDEKTRARTQEANLRRAIRERFSLPRLTLFR
ncbi:MAG TPA: hypothetical protein VH087_11430 [Thermoanaerobaculia bacterium]|nr:hypothetical protein [Thermoanaerobaculia bacterium]